MVVKITSPHQIKRVLNYNEQKVKTNQATCIYAGNFLKDHDRLTFNHKLKRFSDLIALNERAQKSNTLHISLNFHPSENKNAEELKAIAISYMGKIGFGVQPFLVYEHRDAGHPHIHIVTTNIQSSGKRIDTFRIGKLKSEPARKEIETEFGLIRAGDKQIQHAERPSMDKIEYGKSETKRSITNVLDKVLNHYYFNSLPSLNAVLKTFQVIADPGKEGGRMRKFNGLRYQMLDAQGKKVGVPIKASSIYSNPTLARLEEKFLQNQAKRKAQLPKLKQALDLELSKKPGSLNELETLLKAQHIDIVLRQNDQGFLYGITFVDHRNKTVYNGSEVGRQYSAAALQKKLTENRSITPTKLQQTVSSKLLVKRKRPEHKLD
ncbi:MAG TPA: relaxase/mobilization nuclease domain-containing protein, partial [Puia sp.]